MATRFLKTRQPPRSSRRASANDYNQAYRENEGAYGDERRRSSGPWLLLLFLMLAAGAAGAGVWYYQTKVKTVATNGSTDSAPVVAAPEQSAKSAPEQPLDGQTNAAGSATSKKQIYDRIIGDNEVLGGQVVPTEEAPIQPEAQQGDAEQIPQPAGSLRFPLGRRRALPLPMPPPPGTGNDTQGALSTPPAKQHCGFDVLRPTTTNSTGLAVESEIAPVPGENAAAATNTSRPRRQQHQRLPWKKLSTSIQHPSSKSRSAKKTKATAEDTLSWAQRPLFSFLPPIQLEGGQNASAPVVVDQPVATPPAPVVKKKKTLLGLFRGTNDQVPADASAHPAPPRLSSKLLHSRSLRQSSSRPHQPRLQAAAADILFSSPHSSPKLKPAPSLAG